MQPLRVDSDVAISANYAKLVDGDGRGAAVESARSDDGAEDYQHQLLRLLNTLHRENTQLRAQLRTDPLTGLFNRRALFDELEREWEHWLRYRRTASLILIDVNDFKTINDTLGHQAGDDVLIGIARQLAQQVRASDWLARLGGDEFAILVRDTDASDADQLASKLREAQFVFTDETDTKQRRALCFAVGVATLSADINSVRQWLEAADQHMYRHKRSVHLRPLSSERPHDAPLHP